MRLSIKDHLRTMNIFRLFPVPLLWAIVFFSGVEVVCAQQPAPEPVTTFAKGENPPATSSTKLSLTSEEQAWLAKNHTIRVHYWQHPPYLYLKDGEVVGISVDLLNAVAQNAGLTFQYENRLDRFADVLKGLIEHQSPDVMAALMPTPEREKVILLTEPYIHSPRFIFTRDDTPFVSSIEKLFGEKVAVVKDYVTHKTLIEMFPRVDLLVYNNDEAALGAVSSGEATAFIGDLISTPAMINEFGLKNLKVVSPSGLPDHPLAMGIRNDWPELRSIISKGLHAIPPADKAAIINKWSSVKFDHGISPEDIWTWVLTVAIAISGIILLFALWTKSLKQQVQKRTTELKASNKSLLDSEEKFRTLVTNTEEIVYMIAKDGTFLLSEGKGLAKLGMKPGQVVGKSVFDLYKDYPDMLEKMRKTFNGETITGGVNVDGNYFRSWYTPHKNHEGETIGLLGLSVNITEQKQAENRLQEYQQRLRALASELTLTEERERRNIALELHDQVGQSLAVMRMQLAVARKESNGRKVAAILDEVSGSLRAAIQDTRHIISDLSSPIINELGLAAALSEWLKERIGEYYGLESEFIDDGEPKPLDKDTEAILFRSVRELLTNVIKHANANRVSVSLQRIGSTIQVVVEDDGAGLADGMRTEKDSADGGFGLFSVEERMSDLGGSLEIESHPGRGVRAILTAPLESGQ